MSSVFPSNFHLSFIMLKKISMNENIFLNIFSSFSWFRLAFKELVPMKMPYQSRQIFLIFIRSLPRSSEDRLPMDQCAHRLNSISTLSASERPACLFILENSTLSDSFIMIILLLQLTSTLTWILNCEMTIVMKMSMRIHVAHKNGYLIILVFKSKSIN